MSSPIFSYLEQWRCIVWSELLIYFMMGIWMFFCLVLDGLLMNYAQKYSSINTYSAMNKFSRWQIDYIFSYFSQKIGFDISCKLSLWRQFAWNVKSYFLEKNIKNISKCCLLKFAPSMQSVKDLLWHETLKFPWWSMEMTCLKLYHSHIALSVKSSADEKYHQFVFCWICPGNGKG